MISITYADTRQNTNKSTPVITSKIELIECNYMCRCPLQHVSNIVDAFHRKCRCYRGHLDGVIDDNGYDCSFF